MEDQLIDSDPTNSKRLSMSDKVTERHALSFEAFRDIGANLYKLNRNDRILLGLLMFTGMRRGEALGLQWNDINYETGLIHIERNVYFKGNQPRISTPKSKAGFRDIPICGDLRKILGEKQQTIYVVGKGDAPITESCFDRT